LIRIKGFITVKIHDTRIQLNMGTNHSEWIPVCLLIIEVLMRRRTSDK
jgi:hypothetical protein